MARYIALIGPALFNLRSVMEIERGRDPATTTFNLLFVCTGNTCRSPMAEAVAREELERRGWRHVRVASAGTSADWGSTASANAVSAARRRGLDLDAHASRPLTPELVDWADLVLAMSPSHLGAVDRLGGAGKVALLAGFASGDDDAPHSVPDPFGGDERVYEATLDELHRLVRDALDRLSPILHP